MIFQEIGSQSSSSSRRKSLPRFELTKGASVQRRKLIMSQGEKKVFNVSFFPWLGQNFYPALLPPLHFLPYHLSFLYFLKKNKSLCRLRKWAPKVFCVPFNAGMVLQNCISILHFNEPNKRSPEPF